MKEKPPPTNLKKNALLFLWFIAVALDCYFFAYGLAGLPFLLRYRVSLETQMPGYVTGHVIAIIFEALILYFLVRWVWKKRKEWTKT